MALGWPLLVYARPVARLFFGIAALHGLLGVGLGAFGAHALRNRFGALDDGAKRLEWWQTATTYQLVHLVGLFAASWVLARGAAGAGAATVAGWCFTVGVVLFSGSLYVMALSGLRWLGAVTPFGGLALLAGWTCLVVAAWRGAPG